MRAGGGGDAVASYRPTVSRSRSGGTQKIEDRLTDLSVETDVAGGSPYAASEPLVDPYPESSSRDRAADFRTGRPKGGMRRSVETESQWGEILALVFAAAVGIGCGFMFLRLFAPSLLAKWHF